MEEIILSKEICRLIEKSNFAFATSDKDNKPNVIVVGGCEVVGENKILITDNFMNKTRTNLLNNNKVAIAVWGMGGNEGYQLKGKAEYFTAGEWKERVDNDPENQGLAHKGAVVVTIEEVWDLLEPKLLQGIS